MADPVSKSIPEWTWVKIADKVRSVRVYRTDTSLYYYYTTRIHNSITPVIPDPPVAPIIPDDAVKLFDVNGRTKEYIEADEAIDVFIMGANFDDDVDDDGDILVLQGKGTIDVAIQDQHTPTVIAKFNQVHNNTELAAEALMNQRNIVVTSSTGIVVGSYIILFSITTQRFYFGTATTISGAPTIVLDTPLDSTFPAGTFVDIAITDLTVNGSVTPQTFGLRGIGAPPGVDIDVDITRIIFYCVADSPVDLTKFGDLASLLNGLVLRKRDGSNHNIFNVKNNGEMAGIMFDFTPSAATNPSKGIDGFIARLTFAGQEKMGVTIRLPVGEDLELIVQDDLLLLTFLEIVAEGSIVLP